jgi:hypothetical protein
MTDTLTAAEAAYALAGRAARWLDTANGNTAAERVLRVLKVTEEYGELCAELVAGDRSATAREAVDVVITALTAQASYGHAPYGFPGAFGALVLGTPNRVAALRSVDLGATCGRLAQAVIGETGQNPRKGRTHTVDDVIDALAEVVIAAVMLLPALGVDPEETIRESVARIDARLDEMGVAP